MFPAALSAALTNRIESKLRAQISRIHVRFLLNAPVWGQFTLTNASRWGIWKSANDPHAEQESNTSSQVTVCL